MNLHAEKEMYTKSITIVYAWLDKTIACRYFRVSISKPKWNIHYVRCYMDFVFGKWVYLVNYNAFFIFQHLVLLSTFFLSYFIFFFLLFFFVSILALISHWIKNVHTNWLTIKVKINLSISRRHWQNQLSHWQAKTYQAKTNQPKKKCEKQIRIFMAYTTLQRNRYGLELGVFFLSLVITFFSDPQKK